MVELADRDEKEALFASVRFVLSVLTNVIRGCSFDCRLTFFGVVSSFTRAFLVTTGRQQNILGLCILKEVLRIHY